MISHTHITHLPLIRSQGPQSSLTVPDLQSTKWFRALAEWDAAKHPSLCILLLCLVVAVQWECGIRCYWFEHCPKQMGWRRKQSNWQQAQRTPAVSFHLTEKRKQRSISNVLLCFPRCPPLHFFFPQIWSDRGHTSYVLSPEMKVAENQKMCRYTETNSISIHAKAFPAEFYPLTTPTLPVLSQSAPLISLSHTELSHLSFWRCGTFRLYVSRVIRWNENSDWYWQIWIMTNNSKIKWRSVLAKMKCSDW